MASTWSEIKTKYYHIFTYIYIYGERGREREFAFVGGVEMAEHR
jgi:hypothetical protein